MKKKRSLREGVPVFRHFQKIQTGSHKPLWSIADIAEFLGIQKTTLSSALIYHPEGPKAKAIVGTHNKRTVYDKDEVVEFWYSLNHTRYKNDSQDFRAERRRTVRGSSPQDENIREPAELKKREGSEDSGSS